MIDGKYFLVVVALLVMGTLLIRGLFIAFSSRMKISDDFRLLFTYIPAAIFPGIIIPATFFHQGQVAWLEGKERFIILLASSIFCYFVRSTLAVICLGLTLLYLIKLLA